LNSGSDKCSEETVKAAINGLDTNGVCVIKNVLSAEKCRRYSELIFDIASRERKSKTAFFYGREGTLQRAYHLSAKIQEQNCLIVNPIVLKNLDEVFYRETWHDRYYLCSWHANIIPPGGEAQKVDIDVSVPDPIPSWMMRMNTNFLLHDYTLDNRCTMIYPGSHKLLSRPTPERLEMMEAVPIEAPAGSLVLWSGHVWHASGNNYSKNNRLAVLGTYTASFMREMCNEEDNLRLLTLNGTKTDKAVLDIMGVSHGIKYEPYLSQVLQRCKK
jgi:ectoine hydroxylase-related dioxygenase (phytanoyl-CoA dioxygenase family)